MIKKKLYSLQALPLSALTIGLLTLGGLQTAYAEPAKGTVGRYPDGRAYRIDNQGYQLSDQLAELEMTIREQENQILSCESQLRGKSSKATNAASTSVSEESCRAFTAPLTKQIAALSTELRDKVSGISSGADKVANLQAELKRNEELSSARIASLESELAKTKSLLSSAPKSSQLSALAEESLELRRKLLLKSQEATSTAASLDGQVKRSQEEKSYLNEQIVRLQQELQEKQKREKELLSGIDTLSAQLGKTSQVSRAMLSAEIPEAERQVDFGPGDKKNFQQQLGEIQKLVIVRKDIFDSVRSSRKGISVQMQQLRTADGISLDQLRQLAAQEIDGATAARVTSGLSEIKMILESDIAVMNRIVKHL